MFQTAVTLLSENGCNWLEMVLKYCKCLEWLYIDGNGWIWQNLLKTSGNGWSGWKLLEIAGMAENG